jgi:hypothetical protein
MNKLLLMQSSWFETAQERLLTMRDLILRSGHADKYTQSA